MNVLQPFYSQYNTFVIRLWSHIFLGAFSSVHTIPVCVDNYIIISQIIVDHSRIAPGSFPSVLVLNLKGRKDIFISDFRLATVKLSIFVLFCILLNLQNLRRQSTVRLYIVHYFKQLKLTNASNIN